MQPRSGAARASPTIELAAACRRAVEAQRELFDASTRHRRAHRVRGRRRGRRPDAGDRPPLRGRVFAELERLHADGHEFTAISEERGAVTFGDGESPLRVVIDPIDGSLNARRTIPAALASASRSPTATRWPTSTFGYVYEFGAGEEFVAAPRRGRAARRPRRSRAEAPATASRWSASRRPSPSAILPALEALQGKAYRIRVVGSIAIALCYVAAGRFDGMLTARACRSVDAAAGQLIAREAGAAVEFAGGGLERCPARPRRPLRRRRRARRRRTCDVLLEAQDAVPCLSA